MIAFPTLSSVRDEVTSEGGFTLASAVVDNAIRAATRRVLSLKRWPWLESRTTTLVTAAGASSVSLGTADLAHVDAVRLAYGAARYAPDHLEREDILERLHRDTDSGTPQYWSTVANTVVLYPTPDRIFNVYVDYVSFPTTMPTADSDVVPFPADHIEVVKWDAIRRLCFRQRDPVGMNMAESQFVQARSEALGAYNIGQRQQGSRVKTSDWWRM